MFTVRPLNNFELATGPSVPALIHVPEEVNLYLNSYQAAPLTAAHVTVIFVALMVEAINDGGNSHPARPAVVTVIPPQALGWLLEAQKVRASILYSELAVSPPNNFNTAPPVSVPPLIQVPEEVNLYLNSYHPAPPTAGQVTVTLVALIVEAVNTGGKAQPVAVGVIKLVLPHSLG